MFPLGVGVEGTICLPLPVPVPRLMRPPFAAGATFVAGNLPAAVGGNLAMDEGCTGTVDRTLEVTATFGRASGLMGAAAGNVGLTTLGLIVRADGMTDRCSGAVIGALWMLGMLAGRRTAVFTEGICRVGTLERSASEPWTLRAMVRRSRQMGCVFMSSVVLMFCLFGRSRMTCISFVWRDAGRALQTKQTFFQNRENSL